MESTRTYEKAVTDITQTPPKNPTTKTEKLLPTQTITFHIDEINNEIKEQQSIWIDPLLDRKLLAGDFEEIGGLNVEEKEFADFWILDASDQQLDQVIVEQIFVLAVPFISKVPDLSFDDLKWIVLNEKDNENNFVIWIHPKDFNNLQKIFSGELGEKVIVSEERPESCLIENCYRIFDFSDIEPSWKILAVDNQNPLDKNFNVDKYPLAYRIGLIPNQFLAEVQQINFSIEKKSNFEPSKLTSILITGTTALVRNTAFQIEQFGYDYPYKNIEDILQSVDLVHISNEVPFYTQCPPAVPVRPEMRFCSDPQYVNTLVGLGVDIVELTGNHLLDWGSDAFLETLSVYEKNDIKYYGAGRNQNEASQAVVLEHNGNKIVFLGCNITGPENNWATEENPGALRCNLDSHKEIVSYYHEQGFSIIFTFQHYEFNTFRAVKQLREDFWQIAKAGADVVSGSQAHYPHGVDFVDSSFIHYGLGNFLFDQMYSYWGMATIDVHYFYDNEYINTKQLAIINENYGQPRLMTPEEQNLLLDNLYSNSFYYENMD